MSDAGQFPQRCPAVKKNGTACTANVGPDGYCIGHSPGAQEARSKGGAATSKAARARKLIPARLRPVADILESALNEVHMGDLEPRKATAMAALAGALIRVINSGELEERVRELEKRSHESGR